MQLEIITPDKQLFSGEIKSIKVPGTKAPFQVLKNHAPVLSTLDRGSITIVTSGDEEKIIKVSGGMIEVNKNKIIVLAETFRVG